MIIANFMDSSLKDLETKGVLSSAPEIYNPRKHFDRVLHFTPHAGDLALQPLFDEWHVTLIHYPAAYLGPIKILKAAFQIWRRMKKERVDLVRGRLPYLGSLIACLCARLQKLPFVVSLGGDNRIVQERNGTYNYNSRLISYAMEWLVLKLALRIIAPNQFTKSYVEGIIGKHGADCKCVIIPWISTPIPESVDSPPNIFKKLDIPSTSAIVPIIGFLNAYKYADVLFDALDGLNLQTKNGQKVIFCFCGDGPLRPEGEKRFSKATHVRFFGWQERSIVHALLRHAEFVLIPMSGNVLMEAASIGKPVITSEVEWHSELVINRKSGLVVDPHEPSTWRRAINEMLASPNLAKQMGEQLKQRYWADYAPDRSIDLEFDLYKRLIQSQSVQT